MSLDEIRKSIEDESRSSAARIRKEAEREEGLILDEAGGKADAIIKAAKEEAEYERKRITAEHDAGVELEVNSIMLNAKEQVIESSVVDVRKEVERMLAKRSGELFKKAVAFFSKSTGSSSIKVVTNKRLASSLGIKKENLEYGDMEGFVLKSADPKAIMDLTAKSISKRYENEMRNAVSRSVFGGKISDKARSREKGARKKNAGKAAMRKKR